MGDRANVMVKGSQDSRVYLYTHWGGEELPIALRDALRRGRSRWGDDSYLARIIFCEMVKGKEAESTGFGISAYLVDNEHPILVVDPQEGTVSLEATAGQVVPGRSWTFGDYCKLEFDSDRSPWAVLGGGEDEE